MDKVSQYINVAFDLTLAQTIVSGLLLAASTFYSAMAIVTFGTSLILAGIAFVASILDLKNSIIRCSMVYKAKELLPKFIKICEVNNNVLLISKILSVNNFQQCKDWEDILNDPTITLSYKEEIVNKVFAFKDQI
jgi:hypothetical protein